MPQPITVDVVCGTSSDQATFRFACSAAVNPQEFVRAVYDAVQVAIEESTAAPTTSPQGEETGSAPVEQVTVPVVRSRRPAPDPPKVAKFDPDAARARAAAAS